MGGNGGSSSRMSISAALEKAREADPEDPEPEALAILNVFLADIWRKIRAGPNSYILSPLEHSVFNFYFKRYEHDPLTQPAIRRYWDNHKVPETNSS